MRKSRLLKTILSVVFIISTFFYLDTSYASKVWMKSYDTVYVISVGKQYELPKYLNIFYDGKYQNLEIKWKKRFIKPTKSGPIVEVGYLLKEKTYVEFQFNAIDKKIGEIYYDQTVTINTKDQYKLPNLVNARFSDNKYYPVCIKWNRTVVNPKLDEDIIVEGKLESYDIKVNQKIRIRLEVDIKNEKMLDLGISSVHYKPLYMTQDWFDQVTDLWISSGTDLDSLNEIDKFRNLTTLFISMKNHDFDLTELSKLKNLKKLTVVDMDIEDIEKLFLVTSVEELIIKLSQKDKFVSLKNMEGVSNLVNLRYLVLDVYLSDFADLAKYAYSNELVWHSYVNNELDKAIAYNNKRISLNENMITADKKAQEIVNNIISNNMSDREKVVRLNNYLVDNVVYDKSFGNKYPDPMVSYTEYGALINKYAVCEGYAKAFMALCKYAKVDCIMVYGQIEKELTSFDNLHTWNMVKIDDRYYHVDATWNDSDPINKYLLITDEIISEDHFWNKIQYPQSKNQ